MFKAILVKKEGEGVSTSVARLAESDIPDAEVDIDVEYSTLNYKDALAITGRGPVVRNFPMIPGIDLAGIVSASRDPQFKPGDAVLLNGWGRGELSWGGLAEKARVPARELMHLPAGMTTRTAMAIGTAGYTAALCVLALMRHGVERGGEILVTGGNGGVGGYAIRLLAAKGYAVVASSGRMDHADRLRALGALEVIGREALSKPGKPLQKERWAGVVDSVGSHTLVNACASTRYRGVVTACGLAQGIDFPATVAPFILRGVTLVGVESSQTPPNERIEAWNLLGEAIDVDTIDAMVATEVSLEEAIAASSVLLDGGILGRVVVKVG